MSPKKDVVLYCYCTHFKIVTNNYFIFGQVNFIENTSFVYCTASGTSLQFIKRIEKLLSAASGEQTGRTVVSSLAKKAHTVVYC